MIRRDAELVWRPGRVYIPANHFTGITNAALTAGAGSEAQTIGSFLAGTGTGAPVQQEVSTFGLVGVLMDTAADELNHLMLLPYDLDITQPLYARVHWTSGSATTADTIDWLVRYLKIVPDTTVLASAATALDTQPSQDTVIGAYTHQVTSWGVLDPRVTAIADTVEMIEWEVEMDAFAAGLTEDKFFLGLELAYTPKRLAGVDGMRQEAKRATSMFSKEYPN